jgi:hypothetical protein
MPRNILMVTLASLFASATAASAADYAVETEQQTGYMVEQHVAVEEDDSLIDVNVNLGLFDDDEEEVAMADDAPDGPEMPEAPLISK